MYCINKIVGSTITPGGIGLIMLLFGLILKHLNTRGFKRAKGGKWWIIASVVWIWLWSTPLMTFLVGASLEREFLVDGKVTVAESYPKADLIVLLGGSMHVEARLMPYTEMWTSADRVWMAAQLYRAGKAPKIYATGGMVEQSTSKLLSDFGVPREAVIFNNAPRNTEEEAKALAKRSEKKVLLVTSAWHMKRARFMFERYASNIEVIPAPRDFENTITTLGLWKINTIIPNTDALRINSGSFREWLGIFGYKVFR